LRASLLPPAGSTTGPRLTSALIGIVAAVLLAGAGVAFWFTRDAARAPPAAIAANEPASLAEPVAGQKDLLRNSDAVLPFSNLSPDPVNAYFAAGIHEETQNQLGKIKALAVIARTTVLKYANSTLSVPEIARELGVEAVLEGSVRYTGNRVRVTAQLIDGQTGTQLWSEAYDRDLTDVFVIQTDIARQITTALKTEFSIPEQAAINKRPTDNIAAYAAYLKAMSMFSSGLGPADEIHASFDEAIALDPNFAQALAYKATLHGLQISLPYEGTIVSQETARFHAKAARRYAERALAIEPDQAEAYLALGMVAEYERRWADGADAIRRAYALNPNDYGIMAMMAFVAMHEHRPDEFIALMEKSMALNPQLFAIPRDFSNVLALYGQFDYAEIQARQAVALAPEISAGYVSLATVTAVAGKMETALAAARDAEQRGVGPSSRAWLMIVYSLAGRPEEVARLLAKQRQTNEHSPLMPGEWMMTYLAAGDYELALQALTDGLAGGNSLLQMEGVLRTFHDHWLFDPLRNDPRFAEAIATINTPRPAQPE